MIDPWAGRRNSTSCLPPILRPPPTTTHHGTDIVVNITVGIGPLAALIAGILILVMPRLLNYIVALYLIIIGLIGIFGVSSFHIH